MKTYNLHHSKAEYDSAISDLLKKRDNLTFLATSPLHLYVDGKIVAPNSLDIFDVNEQLGRNFTDLEDYPKAISFFNDALQAVSEKKYDFFKAVANNDLGIVYRLNGESLLAIDHLKSAIPESKKDDFLYAQLLANLGAAYRSIGDCETALLHLKESMENINKVESNTSNQEKKAEVTNAKLKCYISLGVTYRHLNDSKNSLASYREAESIIEQSHNSYGAAACYMDMGVLYENVNEIQDPIAAFKNYKKALEFACQDGEVEEIRKIYTNMANCLMKAGDYQDALTLYQKSLGVAEQLNAGPTAKMNNFQGMGRTYLELEKQNPVPIIYSKAFQYLQSALKIAEETSDFETQISIRYGLGQFYDSRSLNGDALIEYIKAVDILETLGETLQAEQHQIGLFANVSEVYEAAILGCMKADRLEDAFNYLEKSRSRAFLDLISSTKIAPTMPLNDEFRSLIIEADKTKANLYQMRQRQKESVASVDQKLITSQKEQLSAIYDKLEKYDPEFVSMRRGKPIDNSGIISLLASQNVPVTFVEYYTTDNFLAIFLVSSKSNKIITSGPICLTSSRLRQLAFGFLEKLESGEEIGDEWFALSDYLIKPISKYLTDNDLIYFVPHGVLHYIPLHILRLGEGYVCSDHPVAYLPSSSVLRYCKAKGSRKRESCMAVGVGFEQEAKDVAKIFESEALLGSNKNEVTANWSNKDIVHLSCHGDFNVNEPMSSGIIFADGTLTARDILGCNLNAELVTLSACKTGMNSISKGDELSGLLRAVLYAGASSTIVSLWSVNGESTRELMKEFYIGLKKIPNKAQALQQAQQKIMKQNKYSNPYYWAPFVLVGDWDTG